MNSLFEYKDYFGSAEISKEDECFIGKLLHIRDSVTYHGDSFEELESNFKEAVDGYLELCKEEGVEPSKTHNGIFQVRTNPKIHKKASLIAQKRGQTLNKFVGEAIEEKIHQLTG
ncbi:MAG: type II toxin-antitoxin system HicB family antitoxin [Cytophagales bacterium]|nr:type II toxin-antitoxin system HicB family antitoxin [Cytophagales bacterium]